MEIVPAATTISFEVTFDSNSLYVAMSVYDTTTGSAVLVSGPTAMNHVVANTYFGTFSPTLAHSYIIVKAVYTDGTFTTLHPDYAQGTESIYATNIGGSSSELGCQVVGFIVPTPQLIGYVQEQNPIIGLVNC